MGFGGISIWQLLIILVVVFLIFGSGKLKSLGSDLGSSIKGFKKAVSEAQRVLKSGGLFFLSPFGDQDSSFHKVPDKNGVIDTISSGHISGLGGQVLFLSYRDLIIILNERNGWDILSMKQITTTDFDKPNRIQQVTWNVILKKN